MNKFTQNLGHLPMAALSIVSVTVLALHNSITGSEALIMIGTISGVSMGGGVASALAGTPVQSLAGGSSSTGAVAPTTTSDAAPASSPTPAPNPTPTASA